MSSPLALAVHFSIRVILQVLCFASLSLLPGRRMIIIMLILYALCIRVAIQEWQLVSEKWTSTWTEMMMKLILPHYYYRIRRRNPMKNVNDGNVSFHIEKIVAMLMVGAYIKRTRWDACRLEQCRTCCERYTHERHKCASTQWHKCSVCYIHTHTHTHLPNIFWLLIIYVQTQFQQRLSSPFDGIAEFDLHFDCIHLILGYYFISLSFGLSFLCWLLNIL